MMHKMSKNVRKRARPVTDDSNKASKRRLCMEENNENSRFRGELLDKHSPDLSEELNKIHQTKLHVPYQLIGLIYQLDLLMLYLLRKSTYKQKFEDPMIDKFNQIVLRYDNKYTVIQVESVDKYFIDNNISYARLFTKEKRSFSLNNYLDNFIKHISNSNGSLNNIQYYIIYTNADLDITEGKILKKGRSKEYYPFNIGPINLEESGILKDLLFTDMKFCNFYQFSQDEATRENLLKRLNFTSSMQKVINEKNLSQEEIKGIFLQKLVFAVNQPNREALNIIVKKEIKENHKIQYHKLQDKLLCHFIERNPSEKNTVIYEFKILICFLHDIFMHKKMFSINFLETGNGKCNGFTIQHKNKITYLKTYEYLAGNIGYSQLFPPGRQKNKSVFSINDHFALFVEKLADDIEYIILHTNAELELADDKRLKEEFSADFYPFKFNNVDIQQKKYKILRDCSCINGSSIFVFAKEETRDKLSNLLKFPHFFEKERGFSTGGELEIKERFLDKLIFAVNQPDKKQLSSIIKNGIDKSHAVPYNYEELQEIALRWSESHEPGAISKGMIEKLLEDIKNKRSSYEEIQIKDIEKIRFAKSVVGSERMPTFNQFLIFLIKGEGVKYLEILKINGVNICNMSSILSESRANALKAFEDLYNLWFDEKGNKTKYLRTLKENNISLSTLSGILGGAGSKASVAFEDLYNLWFNMEGNKTQYLKTLEWNRINLSNVSNILGGSGCKASKAFKDLYKLWFNEEGDKTQYLKTLEDEGINLCNISSILSKAGANAAKAFKDLYDLWFDKEGNKTRYLKTIEKEGINLGNMSSILSGSRANAAKAFKDLYDLWFDEEGNKTQHLKILEDNGISLSTMSNILSGRGAKVFKELYDLWFDCEGNKKLYLKTLEENGLSLSNMSNFLSGTGTKAFKDLHNLWFDDEGNKTQYLRVLEDEGINLSNMSSILNGAGAGVVKSFKDLYNLWFDKDGNKTQYMKTLEANGINLHNLSSVLSGTGVNAVKAFRDLYHLWFDGEGNKTKYLKTLEKAGISLSNMSSILHGAGAKASEAFKDLYDLWFNEQGNKTQYSKTLEERESSLSNISNILNGAGINAAKSFKNLYYLWFEENGNTTHYLKTLEKEGINLPNISSILGGAGYKAPKAFKDLYDLWFDEEGNKKRCLKHFIKKKDGGECFTIHNLSSILSRAGAKAKDAFEKLHNVCFNKKGKRTALLNDFYSAGFKSSNLSCLLCGAGARAALILKRLHSICFDGKGQKTELMNDFFNIGFKPADLCNILSGAVDCFVKFHDFCCEGKTKKYLNHFIKEQKVFKLNDLCKILHGAKANICSALKDFHDTCFDEIGNKTQILDDFRMAGFKPSNLSNILSMTGNNASSILRNFHVICFNNYNYLNNFLAEKELFTPKVLSHLLDRAGLNICRIIEKLHDLCFDKTGNKTKYLNNLIENKSPSEILDILYSKVRKDSCIFL